MTHEQFNFHQSSGLQEGDAVKTHIVRLEANIGQGKGFVELASALEAIRPRMADGDGLHIDLTAFTFSDDDPEYWRLGRIEIERQVAGFLQHRVRGSKTQHLSIFAFAPIPLLMILGKALGDRMPMELYQRHRDTSSWIWSKGHSADVGFSVQRPVGSLRAVDVALLLSVSGRVDVSAVSGVMTSNGLAMYEIAVPEPQPDLIKSPDEVKAFGRLYRQVISEISARHGADCRIHFFPAVPIPIAIECGRRLLPKADPEVLVYDMNRARGGFSFALALLGAVHSATDSTKSGTTVYAQQKHRGGDRVESRCPGQSPTSLRAQGPDPNGTFARPDGLKRVLTPTDIAQVREALCSIYDSTANIQIVAKDSGLNWANIDATGPAELVWQSVLDEALRHGQANILMVVDQVFRRYPSNEALIELRDALELPSAKQRSAR